MAEIVVVFLQERWAQSQACSCREDGDSLGHLPPAPSTIAPISPLRENIMEVIRNQEFLLLPAEELHKLLASDDLNVPDEETIFDALMKWVKYDMQRRCTDLSMLLAYIRLPLLPPQTGRREKVGIVLLLMVLKPKMVDKLPQQFHINPDCSLEGQMLKMKLRYFGHLMRKKDSLEKSLMLGTIEGKRRRGRQIMRWLDGVTEAVGESLGGLRGMVEDRKAWRNVVHGVVMGRTRLRD
ncbi:Kelch-like protein 1 [Varanus komodoensis]|nr:Kelch-like protein 1 [Varanus komodoensis]